MPPRAPPEVLNAPTTRSQRSVVVGFVILFCLFLCTSWIGTLSFIEKRKHGTLRKAVVNMRNYMVSLDENYTSLNDTDLIWEVEKLALPLALLTVKHQELKAELADLQAKLSTDWIIHRGKMYYFGDQTLQQEEWVKRCAAHKAEIVSIEDKDEQRFLGTSVASRSGPFWIGYKYHAQDSKFVWQNPAVPAYPTYWADGFPQHPKDNQCVLLSSKCPMPYKCWMNHPCDEHQKGICKKSPEMKWLS